VSRDEGFTYVEVLVAAMLIAVALVPLMQLFPGLIETELTDETTMVLGAVAVRNMESITTSLRNNIASVASGSATCADFPNCLVVRTVTTEASSATPGVGSLVDVGVTACADANGSGACDASETQVHYDAKVTSRP